MVVYVDIVFAANFVLDFAMLMAAAKVRGLRPVLWRCALSAAVGAGYVLFMFVPELSAFYSFVVKCLFSAAMIMTAFGFRSPAGFAGDLAAFYAVNAAAAGAVLGAHYLLASSHDVWNGILFAQAGGVRHALGLSLWSVLAAGAGGALLFRKVQKGALRKQRRESYLAEVNVRIGAAEVRCTGLIDTGNQLYDPLTRAPVMMMEADLWKGVVPERWMNVILTREPENIVRLIDEADRGAGAGGAPVPGTDGASGTGAETDSGASDALWRERIRLVPYRGMGSGGKLMVALKPDEVAIERNGRTERTKKALVGIEAGPFAADGAYRALVHPALVESNREE